MSVDSKRTHVGGINTASRTISQAEILTANSSPLTIIAAPGSNKMISVLYAAYSKTFGSALFGGGGSWGIYYASGSGVPGSPVWGATELTALNSSCKAVRNGTASAGVVDPAAVINQPLVFSSAADFTNAGSGSSIKVTVRYIVVDLS